MANAVRKNQMNYNHHAGYTRNGYMEGNTVRRIQSAPKRTSKRIPKKQTAVAVVPKSVSKATIENRERAQSMSPGFVVFLLGVCVAILFACVNYIQMKSEITGREKALASLESEYSQLKADNDAYYSQVSSSGDIETIKAIAIKRLGMKYASEDQVITYETERSSYVRQYQNVPSLE